MSCSKNKKYPKIKNFWDAIYYTSPFLQSSSDEINSCFLCTGNFIDNLIEECGTTFRARRRKTVLCEKCERDVAFPLSVVRETGSSSQNENMIKEITFCDYEAKFFERFFFQYGVAKSEVKFFFQSTSVRSYIAEINENFCLLQRLGGDPDTFASTFYESGERPPTTRLDEFRKCLKTSVKKYEEASRRDLNNDSE